MKSLRERLIENGWAIEALHPTSLPCQIDAMFTELRADLCVEPSHSKPPEPGVTEDKVAADPMIIAGLDVIGWDKVRGRDLYGAYLAMKALEPKRPVEITRDAIEHKLHHFINAATEFHHGKTITHIWGIPEAADAIFAAINPPAEETR